ncbi:MAG: metallophosphoesterase [Phycisphaeraceae bacterium]
MMRHVPLMVLLLGLLAGALHADATVDEADEAFASRQWEEAAALYEEARTALEGAAYHRATYRQAEALRRAERFEEAAPLLRDVLEADDASAGVRANAGRRLGYVLQQDGRYDDAVEALEQTQQIDGIQNTDFADAALLAGDILALDLHRYDDAIAMYERVEHAADYVGIGAGWGRTSDANGRIAYAEALRDDPSAFWVRPYVTHLHDREAQVRWAAGEDDPPGTLELLADDGSVGEYEARVGPFRRETGYRLHVVRLENLQPDTQYQYVARIGEHERRGSFRTAPEPGTPQRITFAVYGDTQDRPEFHRETAPVIAATEPDFVLHTGDLVGRGSYWPHWKAQFFDPAAPILRQTPIWPTVGNHDSFPYYDPFFLDGDQLYDQFTYGNVAVFVLASYRGGGEGRPEREAQLAWVEQALQSSDADWKIVLTHYPMISDNPAHWVNWGQNDFHPIFETHGVDFVLTGHEHIYRRYLPIGAEGHNPIFHITSGGGASVGGDYGHDGEGEPYAPNPLTPVSVRALHFLHFQVEGDELVMEARLRDGTVLERLELTKRDGRLPDELLAATMPLEEALHKVRAYGALQEAFGRRQYRQAPATFEAQDAKRTRFEVRFRNTLPEQAGRLRISPVEDSPWSFEPVVVESAEPIRFEIESAEPVESLSDQPLEVRLQLQSDRYPLVPETYRVLPTD